MTEQVKVKEKDTVVSYSQYTAWLTCPLYWKLGWVDKLRPREGSIHTVFGSAIHSAIQTWVMTAYSKGINRANWLELDEHFKASLAEEFKKSTTEIDGVKQFPCDRETLQEFYEDGLAIIKYLREHPKRIFPVQGWKLLGIELPLKVNLKGNLEYKAYLDIVLQEEETGDIFIIDLKTSTKGWSKWNKTDEKKLNQLLLYKHYYAQVFNVPIDKIHVEFIILKRKLYENCDFPQPRISLFEPANGKISVGKAVKSFTEFIDSCFDDSGKPTIENIKATPSKDNCKFCPFQENEKLCKYSYYLRKQNDLRSHFE